MIPTWARAGGDKAFTERLKNQKTRDQIEKEIVFNILNDRVGEYLRRIQFSTVKLAPELEGKTLH